MYQSRVYNTDELKQCVQQVWCNVDESIIDNAIDEWRKHLRAGERRTLRAYAVENNMPVSSQPYDNISVSFLSNTARFLIFSVAICNKFELLTFPGSARTYLRCGGKNYAVLLEIFILFSAVKEF